METRPAFNSPLEYINARKQAEDQATQEETAFQADVLAVYERGRTDFNFFAGIVVPRLMRTPFPKFYLAIFNLLTTLNPDPYFLMRFALGLPRGFAKTTFLKIITCWFIAYEHNSFILVICATEAKALAFISDIDEMMSFFQTEQVYGRWSTTRIVDNAKKKVVMFNGKKVILVPSGPVPSIRGINENHQRPDLIICDDIQDRESALSPVQNEAMIDLFTATIIKCIENYGSHRKVIFLGNLYPGECLLHKLRINPEWKSMITGAILQDGESLWPELKPLSALFAEYRHDEAMGRGHLWFAEVQNDPLDAKYRLLSEPLPTKWDEIVKERMHDIAFITLDPAGFRKKSDDNVAALHKIYDGVPICTEMRGGQWSPKQTIIEVLTLAMDNGVSVIGIEAVGYQQSLCFWMEYFIEQLGLKHIKVVELQSTNRTKVSRIRDYIAEQIAGDAGMAGQARQLFTYYANQFRLERTDNRDDYLDAPAYAKQVMTKYAKELQLSSTIKKSLDHLPAVVDVDIGV